MRALFHVPPHAVLFREQHNLKMLTEECGGNSTLFFLEDPLLCFLQLRLELLLISVGLFLHICH